MRHTSRYAPIRLAPLLALIGLILALAPLSAPRLAQAAPAAPTNLKAVAVTTNEVELSWDASTGPDVVSYAIYRDGAQLATVDGATLTYNDTTVQIRTKYVYRVEAVDSTGSHSPPSNSAKVKTPRKPETSDTMAPTPPEGLTATAGNGYVLLDWYDSIDNTDVTSYRIYRDKKKLATVNSGTRQYKDASARPGRQYSYSVEAIDVNGLRSRPSEPATAQALEPVAGTVADNTAAPQAAEEGAGIAAPQAAGAPAAAAAYSSQLKRYPYLTDLVNDPADPTRAYVTINWATDRSGTAGTAQWGAVAGNGSCTPGNSVTATRTNLVVNSVLEYQWKASLTLAPGTQYCYRVYMDGVDLLGSDPSPRFWTQVPIAANEPFSFAVFGDWGATEPTGTSGDNPDQANLMQQIASSGVRFGLTTGDNGYPSGSQDNYGDLVESGPSLSAVFGPQFWAVAGDSIALFPAIGNHGFARSDVNHPHLLNWPQDKAVATSGGRYARDCCVGSSTSYASAWYAFDAGVARFYVLHATWSDSCSPSGYECDYNQHWTQSSAEYQWLENDLRTHPSALKFAFFHYPIYSDQRHETSDPFLQGTNSLEGLLSRYGVDIAFYGHAHIYERNLKPGANSLITYLTGGGGAKLQSIGEDPCSAIDAYGIGWSNTNNRGNACGSAPVPTAITQVYHFVKVSVNGDMVTITPIDELGRTFDAQTYTFPTPDTTIDSGPSGTVASTSATFTFSSSTPGATFECRLDGSVFSACTSPKEYLGLSSGAHTFDVRAINSASDADATPASRTWTIDSGAPTATPTSLPPTPTPTSLPPTPTSLPPTPTPGGSTTLTFTAEADAYVEQGSPASNFGSATVLYADTSPHRRSYLRFTVSGVSGSVQSAKLRVFATDGTSNGPQIFATSNTWSETGLTWNNQPGPSGTASDDLGSITTGTWIEFNVTPLVAGNGTYNLVLVPQSSNGLDLSSREGANPPQLVVTTGSGSSTPTPTVTPTPGGGTTLTFSAEADTYAQESQPNANFGTATKLLIDGSPNRHSYLRYTVTGLAGSVQSAKLRVFATDSTSNGPQIFATSNTWSETGLTWSNRPPPGGAASDDKGAISTNTWVEFNVTPLVTGNGTYSFVLVPQSTNGLDLLSREGAQPPQLVLTVGG